MQQHHMWDLWDWSQIQTSQEYTCSPAKLTDVLYSQSCWQLFELSVHVMDGWHSRGEQSYYVFVSQEMSVFGFTPEVALAYTTAINTPQIYRISKSSTGKKKTPATNQIVEHDLYLEKKKKKKTWKRSKRSVTVEELGGNQ